MRQLMGFLSFLVYAYMIVIFIRIILTWFRGMGTGGLQDVLGKVTDPYLNWFRRFPALKVSSFDLSPIVALGVLSLVSRIFRTLAFYGIITIGIILAMILQAAWGAVSFFLGFLIIVLVLRLIGHLSAQSSENTFWHIIETISQPVLYRINRILFKDRIQNFIAEIIVSIVCLGLCYIVLGICVSAVSGALARLPI